MSRLTHTKAWHKESRRQNTIKNSELGPWFKAVLALRERDQEYLHVASDYLIFTLLNGLRRRESASLRVEDVDLKEKAFTIHKTKNGESLTLPLTEYCFEMVKRRIEANDHNYVFPGEGEDIHINDPRRCVAAVRASSGVYFTIHDLRRTFITVAESLDISTYAVKRLVNHSVGRDVTAGYIVWDVERLRAPLQQISNSMLGRAHINKSARVVSFGSKGR